LSELDHLKRKEEDVTVNVDEVDITKLKEWAKKILPNHSMLREIILRQPDRLPRAVALAKMEVFAELMYQETGGRIS
jgi:hypothetical protein